MRIEEDLKLGFKDVLIRPKRSTLKSRSDVELEREFTFKHSGMRWSGVPVIAANMDTVGTFAMAKALASFDILTAVHKHYSVEEWRAFVQAQADSVLRHVMVSTGTSDADFEKKPNRFSRCIPRSISFASTLLTATPNTSCSFWLRHVKPGRTKPSARATS